MKNEFKLGCNLNDDLIPIVSELNDKYKDLGQINEFYGSDAAHSYLAARPSFRLPDVTMDKFASYVKKARDTGIKFNYTMNSIIPYGTKKELLSRKQEVQDFVKYLEDIGVYRITIANPLIGLIIREKSSIPFELSTIMHIDAVTQLLIYKNVLGNVDKICAAVNRNRDFNFLKNTQKACDANGITFDLMVNEYCYNTSGNSSSHCIFRDSCYICHAQNYTKEDAMQYNNYPMGYCMASRGNSEAGWLRSRYILPEWLDEYNKIGVHAFKITGRTGNSDYLKSLAEAYLSKTSAPNQDLISFWKPLQSIYSGKNEKEESSRYMKIPVKPIVENGFIKHWSEDKFLCHEHLCGFGKETDTTYNNSDKVWCGQYACNYCAKFYEKYLKNETTK